MAFGDLFRKKSNSQKYLKEVRSTNDPRYRKALFNERQSQIKNSNQARDREYQERAMQTLGTGPSKSRRAFSNKVYSTVSNAASFRRKQLVVGQSLRTPYNSLGGGYKKGRVKYGRGRPAGPSGKYFIPGVGPVGVYEYRKYFNQLMRERRAKALSQGRLSPEQQAALQALRSKQQAQYQNPENRAIPDTRGYSSQGNINQEIDDAANLVP